MKETPIIMSGNHPKLILDLLKTQTRRTWGLDRINHFPDEWFGIPENIKGALWRFHNKNGTSLIIKCPYGQVGDRLWVRECFAKRMDGVDQIMYRADYNELVKLLDLPDIRIAWKPSIHMFRKDSRILLEITVVRFERLQDIGFDDCLREGIIVPETYHFKTLELEWQYLQKQFMILWNSLNGKRGFPWITNPWVGVIGFESLTVGEVQ